MTPNPFPMPNGGYVHPFDVPFGPNGERVQAFGMTQRAYFAGLAMQSLMRTYQSAPAENIAVSAVRFSDALLGELAK